MAESFRDKATRAEHYVSQNKSVARKRRSLSSNILYDPTPSTRILIQEGAPCQFSEKREYKRSNRKPKNSVCFNLFAGRNSATTCKEILDALYFSIKEGAQCQLSKRRGYKRSDRHAENSVYEPPLTGFCHTSS